MAFIFNHSRKIREQDLREDTSAVPFLAGYEHRGQGVVAVGGFSAKMISG